VTQKLKQISKIRLTKFRHCAQFKNQWSVTSSHFVNGGDRFRKWKDFQLSRTRDLDLGSGQTAYRRATLIDLYLHAKFY